MDEEEIQRATAITTAEYDKLKAKADNWDEAVQNKDSPLQLTTKYIRIENKLEAVKEFVLSRRDDIEKDIEDFGMLKPVLNYFLEAAES